MKLTQEQIKKIDITSFVPSVVKEDGLDLSPEMKEEIDRRLAVAEEQIKNGQHSELNDKSWGMFLKQAHERSRRLLEKHEKLQGSFIK